MRPAWQQARSAVRRRRGRANNHVLRSRWIRSCTARALTGLRRSGSGLSKEHGSACLASRRSHEQWFLTTRCLSMRGAKIRDFAWACRKSHIAGQKCASPEGADIPDFFTSSTGPHLAAFYLAIARSGVCVPPVLRCPSLNCDLIKTRRTTQAAVCVQTHCSRYADFLATARASCSPDRPRPGRRSCGGCACCLQIERRKATSRRVSVGRGNVRCCG